MVENYKTGIYEVINESIQEFLEKKGYVKIPLSVNSIGHFEINATVNGVNAKFILDTGASGTVLNTKDIDLFELMSLSDEEDKAAGLGTTTLHVQKSKGNRIVIDGFEIDNWEVGIIDLENVNEALTNKGSSSVNGVIGADIMKKFNAVIDYADSALYLRKN